MELINHFISDQLLKAIGWTIVHSIWQASFVALVMSIFLNKYQKERSVVRYRIAITSLYMILFFSVVTFCLHYFASSDASNLIVHATSSVDISHYSGSHFIQNFTFGLVHHFDFITTMWVSGMLVFFVKFIGGYLWLKRYELSGEIIPDAQVHVIFNDLIEKMNLTKPVALMESALVKTPMMIRHLKPIILLPVGIINHLELNEVEAILAHELSHISRNDFLQNIMQSLIEIVYYYHPAVWWISANVRAERENCCDEEAVRLCGSAVNYAKALVKIEEMQSQGLPALAIPMARNRDSLLHRVSRILNQPQNKSQIREKLVATVLLFSAFTLFGESNASLNNVTQINAGISVQIEEKENCDIKYTATNPKSVRKVIVLADDRRIEVDTIPHKDCKCNDLSIKSNNEGKSFSLKINNGVINELIIDGKEIEDARKHIKFGDKGEIIKTKDGKLLFKGFSKQPQDEKYKEYDLDDIIENEVLEAPFRISGSDYHDLDKIAESLQNEISEMKHLSKEYLDQFDISSDLYNGYAKDISREQLKELLKQVEGQSNIKFPKMMFPELPTPPQPPSIADVFENYSFIEAPQPPTPPSPPQLFMDGNVPKWKFHGAKPKIKWRRTTTPKSKIFGSLLRDGLIEPHGENTMELTDKYLKINGEKQPSNIWKKYKKIYESQLGHELMEGSKIKLKERTTSKSSFFLG